jgi:hypothetical protein
MNTDGSPHRDRDSGASGPRRPGLVPTTVASLVVALLATGVLSWALIRQYWAQVPDLTWIPGLTFAGLAAVVFVTASNTRARIEHRPGHGRVNPLLVAKFAVLAKTCSLVGAIFAGVYGGIAVWAISEHGVVRVADADLVPAIVCFVGSGLLSVAGMTLERACRVPPRDDDDD